MDPYTRNASEFTEEEQVGQSGSAIAGRNAALPLSPSLSPFPLRPRLSSVCPGPKGKCCATGWVACGEVIRVWREGVEGCWSSRALVYVRPVHRMSLDSGKRPGDSNPI